MTISDAMDILRAQGHAVGTPDDPVHGHVRIWIEGHDRAIDVETGRDLIYLAEGKLTFEDLLGRPRAKAAHAQ